MVRREDVEKRIIERLRMVDDDILEKIYWFIMLEIPDENLGGTYEGYNH